MSAFYKNGSNDSNNSDRARKKSSGTDSTAVNTAFEATALPPFTAGQVGAPMSVRFNIFSATMGDSQYISPLLQGLEKGPDDQVSLVNYQVNNQMTFTSPSGGDASFEELRLEHYENIGTTQFILVVTC
jgi:hypothetical protein